MRIASSFSLPASSTAAAGSRLAVLAQPRVAPSERQGALQQQALVFTAEWQ